MTNPLEIKEKIISFIKNKGPSLPIHLAKELSIETIFSGAFLSGLASEKEIKISDLKVGGSPLYFLPGQESLLENFHTYLKGREKEAFLLLKEKKLLQDDKLEPAIRVALRSIKDFAFPLVISYQNNKIIFWRFYSFLEEEAKKLIEKTLEETKEKMETALKLPQQKEKKIGEKILEDIKKEKLEIKTPEERLEEVIKERTKEIEPIFETKKPKAKNQKEDFLNEIKAFLLNNKIEILKIESQDKKEILARIKENSREILLSALNKKRVTDKDIIKTHKKALSLNLPFSILSHGEITKKLQTLIEAGRNLVKIDTIKQ